MKRFFLSLLLAGGIALSGAEPFVWTLTPEGVQLRQSPGAYVYAEGLTIQAADAAGRQVALQAPAASQHDGMSVYAAPHLLWRSSRPAVRAEISFQGCAKGVCLLPRTILLTAEGQSPQPDDGPPADGFSVRVKEGFMNAREFLAFLRGTVPESSAPDRNFFLSMLLILFGGIGLNLTPCVLPMIPVNLAIIGAAGGRRGLVRALVYGAGMSLAYGVLGLLVLFAGLRFGEWNSHWIFNGAVAVLFLGLGLSLFDLFSLDLSGGLTRIRFADSREGPLWIVLILGGTAALLAGACVAPVVIGTLLYSAELCGAGKLYGALLPFVLGLGMALPWPLAGYGLKILPRPGRYMVHIKRGFGVLILLAGAYYGYLAIKQFRGPGKTVRNGEIERILAAARRDGKAVCLEFTASWCKNCAAMQRTTLQDPEVKQALRGFSLVPVPTENLRDPETEKLLSRFGIKGLPAFVLLMPEGR